jgi:glycosyltransferase involved in cell wall biosynthesis
MNDPLVSVLIRTCGRPELLRRALNSVQSQTYGNIEVIVFEDGPSKSVRVADSFRHLNIRYYCLDRVIGRTRAANLALALSRGRFLNFLDDDDELFSHHIRTMLHGFKMHPEADAIHAPALERKILYRSLDPLDCLYSRGLVKYDEPHDFDRMLHKNLFPIQSVMFKRSLYEQFGGMDEQLEMLEDWDLWIKYSLHGVFRFVNELTSVYYVPRDPVVRRRRRRALQDYEAVIRRKYAHLLAASKYQPPGIARKIGRHVRRYGVRI